MKPGLPRLLALLTLPTLACAKEAPEEPAATPKAVAAPPPKSVSTRPADTRTASLAGMPGPLTPEPGFHGRSNHPPAPAVAVKSTGKIGELLEGDVFFFRLHTIAPCGQQPDPATAIPTARRAVAAEVEITAKREMNLSPRDVSMGVGGITFTGLVDPKRKIEGCPPSLKFGVLREKEVAKGFVLFEIPVTGPGSDLGVMALAYQPTRFGGAGRVVVERLVPPEDKPAR